MKRSTATPEEGAATAAPSHAELPSVALHMMTSADRVDRLCDEYGDTLAMDRPLCERRQLVDDLDAEIVYLRRQLDKIAAFTAKERSKHGWHD